ncbi:MAG: response regulator, partial [Lachnospiraceae bacterium]|nr:response regulator [Lachnospiraceae bacterium]
MKKLAGFIMDDTRPMRDRLFMLLVVSSISTMAVMFFVGIVIGESATDLITLGAGVVLFFIMSVIALKYNLIKILTPVAALILILIVMPVTFFTGGGIYGGSPLWFVFCALFISLLVEGDLKVFLLALDGVVIGICYLAAYRYPSFVTQHDTVEAYWDSFISTIFVCGVLCLMIGFEIRLLKSEMEKSKLKSREIDELNQAQNTFFSSMSHEIRTPINSIIGFNEMILQEDISPEVEENARNIKSSSGVLLSVINDILDMSKMASGKMDIVPVAYDVGDMISEIVNMMWHRASEKGLEFHVSIDPEIPSRLFADEVRIKQILINLLGNAIKYTDNGGITLSLHNGGVSENKILINYSVEDTGIGIRKENIPYLFDAFKRVDEKNNHRIEGTGLGLSIVKQLVELMGGEISVNSVYTRGSTFNVALTQEIVEETPIGKFEAGRTRHHHSDLIKARRSFEAPEARILIVDDNRANLLVEKKLLRNTGMTIDTAESGAECLELTLVTHYDVILMDHLMPEMDGVECFSRIRAQAGGQCQNSPVIVLTANADSVNRALYKRAGFDDYVIKPVDIEVLEGAILAKLPHELVRNVTETGYTGYDEAAA